MMKLLIKRKRMSKEEKIAALNEKMDYIKLTLLPRISPADRVKATLKIERKYNSLIEKVKKGK